MSECPLVAGLPPFDRRRAETSMAALQIYLGHLGQETSYEFLMGISGAAFKLYWSPMPIWCPSATQVCSQDLLAPIGAASGCACERRLGLAFPEAIRLVGNVLSEGRPVLTCGLLGESEWSLIAGVPGDLEYRPAERPDEPDYPVAPVQVRSPFDRGEDYTTYEATAWNGYMLGEVNGKTWGAHPLIWLRPLTPPAPPYEGGAKEGASPPYEGGAKEGASPPYEGGAGGGRTAILRAALERAVVLGLERQYQHYRSGLRAYEAWAEMLCADEEFEEVDAVEMQRRAAENTYLLRLVIDARTAAVQFLRDALPHFPTARRLLEDAVQQYLAALNSLADARRLLPFPLDLPPEKACAVAEDQLRQPALRRAAAAALLVARDREELAVDLLRRAVL